MHAKRVISLANGTLGVMTTASLAVSMIGHGLAQARGLATKHSIKQVDRLLSNPAITAWYYFKHWVPYVVGNKKEILVAMDWTDYDGDNQATLALHPVSNHGRATPLLWRTVLKSTLKKKRNDYEDGLLVRLHDVLPEGVKVTILADRGFGDHKLFDFLKSNLGFEYVIRIRGNIFVTARNGTRKKAADWVGAGGRAKTLRRARVTGYEYEVATVTCVRAKDMKEPWCLVSSDPEAKARTLINHYAKRWTIEPSFRDSKNLRFGMGLSKLHIRDPERRDRLLLLNALAIALLTMLGAAGEQVGLDRILKSNTLKRRTHSLFRQGCMWYDLIPNMPEERLRKLMSAFEEQIQAQPVVSEIFSVL